MSLFEDKANMRSKLIAKSSTIKSPFAQVNLDKAMPKATKLPYRDTYDGITALRIA